MNYIGMDIHKQFTFAVVKDAQGNLIEKEKFDNSKENFQTFLQEYNPDETKIVMESTCVWEYIYDMLEEMKYDVKIPPTKVGGVFGILSMLKNSSIH